MGGVSCVRGLRFPVASVVAMLADAMTTGEILGEHPDLVADDIAAPRGWKMHLPSALRYSVAFG